MKFVRVCLLACGIIDGDPVSDDLDCSDRLSVSLPTVAQVAIKPLMPTPLGWEGYWRRKWRRREENEVICGLIDPWVRVIDQSGERLRDGRRRWNWRWGWE